jgi:hypothetical protein
MFKNGTKVVLFKSTSSRDDTKDAIRDGILTLGQTYMVDSMNRNNDEVRLLTGNNTYPGWWVGKDCLKLANVAREKPSWL